ncbi:MAG TPA: hypothetical protein VJN88_11535 [Ktedonobacterales bacterium]|nr:hypothetical protein [Ktedonobacterales bacterium]
MTDKSLDASLRAILNRYDRPRDISEDEAVAQIRQAVKDAGYVLPTPMWQTFYKTLHGLKTKEEWEASKN